MKELHFPTCMPELATTQLVMRELSPNESHDYFSLCSNIETMRPYGILAHKSLSDSENAIAFLRNEFLEQRGMRFGIFLKANGQLIGDCGFWRFDNRRRRAEAGAKISPDFGQKGFMTEALKKLSEYAFLQLDLHAIEGNVAIDNVPSQRLVEKLGFIREGMRREFTYCAYEARFKDSYLYSMLKRDFVRSSL